MAHAGKLFVFGGCGPEVCTFFHTYTEILTTRLALRQRRSGPSIFNPRLTSQSKPIHQSTSFLPHLIIYLLIYFICFSQGRLHDLHSFDPATKAWEALPANTLRGRGGAGVTAVGGKGAWVFIERVCKQIINRTCVILSFGLSRPISLSHPNPNHIYPTIYKQSSLWRASRGRRRARCRPMTLRARHGRTGRSTG